MVMFASTKKKNINFVVSILKLPLKSQCLSQHNDEVLVFSIFTCCHRAR